MGKRPSLADWWKKEEGQVEEGTERKRPSVKFAPEVVQAAQAAEASAGSRSSPRAAQPGALKTGTSTGATSFEGPGWERAFRRDDEMLRACGLWCKKVEADGACLFRAFSDQLEGDGGSGHLGLRTQCVNYLEQHKAEYSDFVEGNFKQYCVRMRGPTEFGGHMEVEALSKALKVNVLIHRPSEARSAEQAPQLALEVINNHDKNAPCVQVCFHPQYHAGPHYNSVRCVGDDGVGLPDQLTVARLREVIDDALTSLSP